MNACRVYYNARNTDCGEPRERHCSTDPTPEHTVACPLVHHPFSDPLARVVVRRQGSAASALRANRALPLLLAAAPAASGGPYDWILGLTLIFATLSVIFSALTWIETARGDRREERRSVRMRQDEIRQHTEEVLP